MVVLLTVGFYFYFVVAPSSPGSGSPGARLSGPVGGLPVCCPLRRSGVVRPGRLRPPGPSCWGCASCWRLSSGGALSPSPWGCPVWCPPVPGVWDRQRYNFMFCLHERRWHGHCGSSFYCLSERSNTCFFSVRPNTSRTVLFRSDPVYPLRVYMFAFRPPEERPQGTREMQTLFSSIQSSSVQLVQL